MFLFEQKRITYGRGRSIKNLNNMGVIVDENGKIRIELVERYAPEFLEKIQRGERLDERDRTRLIASISQALNKLLVDYKTYVDWFESFEHGSYGLATGHEGLNAFFFRICVDHINQSSLKYELDNLCG